MSYRTGPVTAVGSYRRVDTAPQSASGSSAPAATDEWRGAVSTSRVLGKAAVNAGYEILSSLYRKLEERRDYQSQRVTAGASVSPHRRVQMSASALYRWGRTVGNLAAPRIPLDERSLLARAGYEPWNGITLELLGEHRSSLAFSRRSTTDYVQFQGQLRRPVHRNVSIHTGLFQTLDLSRGAGIPTSSAFVTLDGIVAEGIQARGELRASKSPVSGGDGLDWHRLVQLRLFPEPRVRIEGTWRLDSVARVAGLEQSDHGWDVLVGYDPWSSLTLTATRRETWGEGALARRESLTSAAATVNFLTESQLSASWSRRETDTLGFRGGSDVAAVDLSFWLPRRFRTQVSWRRTGPAESYGLSLDKSF
jgi:hypothetical protein